MKERDEEVVDIFESVSVHDLKTFINHPVWLCIKQDIEDRVKYLEIKLEDAPAEEVYLPDPKTGKVTRVTGFREYQGAIKELKKWSIYILLLLDEKEQIQKAKENEDA